MMAQRSKNNNFPALPDRKIIRKGKLSLEKANEIQDVLSPRQYRNPPSPGDIVPEDVQNILLQIDHQFTVDVFSVGDIANAICKQTPQVSQNGVIVTDSDVYAAIGFFVHKKERTVRGYAEIAAAFPPEVRDCYIGVPFSHFIVARSFGELWKDVLDYSAEHPWATGDELRYIFSKNLLQASQASQEEKSDILLSSGVGSVVVVGQKEERNEPAPARHFDQVAYALDEKRIVRSRRQYALALSQLGTAADNLSVVSNSDVITSRAAEAVSSAISAIAIAIKVLREESDV